MQEGHFARHVRRMRRIYGARQNVIVQNAARELSGLLDVPPTHAGMHILGRLKGRYANDDLGASKAALEAGVFAVPLSQCRVKYKGDAGLVLGFAGATERELKDGILRLKQALQ
jgi:GntR family transcriptional regulator / MocR family aminotransferase